MSGKQDLVVKMTINSQDFDAGLKNAKAQMNRFGQSAISARDVLDNVVKGMIKSFGALGVAVGGTELFKSFITSTQTAGDKWDNAMVAAKQSFQTFASSVMTGNTDIVNSFKTSITEAYKFAEALDDLGSAKISNEYARLKYLNPLNQALVNASDKGATKEQRAASIAEARNYYELYAQNADIVRNRAKEGVITWLRKEVQSEAKNFNITEENYQGLIDNLYLNLINGVFDDATKRFREVTSKEFWKGNALVNSPAKRVNAGIAKMLGEGYTRDQIAMAKIYSRLYETPDDRLKQNLDVIKTYTDVEAELIALQKRINRIADGSETTTTTTTPTTTGGLTWEQQMEMITRQMQRVPINKETIIPLEELIEYEEIIEEDTDAVIEACKARREAMAALNEQVKMGIQTFSAFGSIMTSIGTIADNDMFTKLGKSLNDISSQAQSTISTLMALSGAQTIEGITEVFSKTPGLTINKVAMTATALAGILGMVASAKSAFAGSYANGGIVPGTSYSGDKLWARVNSGERIIPANDWNNMMRGGGTVKFVIEGSQLKGVLDNYESIQAM